MEGFNSRPHGRLHPWDSQPLRVKMLRMGMNYRHWKCFMAGPRKISRRSTKRSRNSLKSSLLTTSMCFLKYSLGVSNFISWLLLSTFPFSKTPSSLYMNWASQNPKSLLFKTSMNALSFPAKLLTTFKRERPKEFQINQFSSKKHSPPRMRKKGRKLENLIRLVSRWTVSSSKW